LFPSNNLCYNLFRYCHNDPIDFTDPMGLDEATGRLVSGTHDRVWDDRAYNDTMAKLQMKFQSAIAIGMRMFRIEKRFAALQRAEKQLEHWMWSQHPQAAQKTCKLGIASGNSQRHVC
jgi:hypothetical protein